MYARASDNAGATCAGRWALITAASPGLGEGRKTRPRDSGGAPR